MDSTAKVEVAYDLARFDSRRRVREALEREPVAVPVTPAELAGKSRTRKKVKSAHRISFFAVFSYVVICAAVLMMIMSYVHLNELSVSLSRQQSELAKLKNDGAKLKIEYERTMNLRDIDIRAAELGLYLPDSSQIVYVDISKPDRVVIYEDESGGFLQGLQSLFAACTDFFE